MATAEKYDMDAFLNDSDEEGEGNPFADEPVPDLSAERRCSQCGSEIRAGTVSCSGCGAKVAPPPLPAASAKPTRRLVTKTSTSPSKSPSKSPSPRNKSRSPRSASSSSPSRNGSATPSPTNKSAQMSPDGNRSKESSPHSTVARPDTPDADFADAQTNEEVEEALQEQEDGARSIMMELCREKQEKFVFTNKDGVRPVDITNPLREFIREGELKKKGTQSFLKRDAARKLFVFKDLIVVTHPQDRKGNFQVSAVINLAISTLTDLVADDDADANSFKINDPSSRAYTFVAKNPTEKKMWLQDLARIIESNMDPSVTQSQIGFTHTLITGSIFCAAVTGRRDQMERLLAHPECDPNIKDESGRSPIHYTVELEHAHVLQSMLHSAKTRGNVQTDVKDSQGRTALEIALDMLSVKSLEIFFTSGTGLDRSGVLRLMAAFVKREDVGEEQLDCLDICFTRAGRSTKESNILNVGTLLHRACTMEVVCCLCSRVHPARC